MSDLFGAPSGIIAFHQDQDQQVATQERFAQMQHLGAMTELTQMQTREAAVKMQREQQMMSLLAKGPQAVAQDPQGNPLTQADQMMDLGTRLTQGGFFKEGGDLLNKGSEIKHREAQEKQAAEIAKTRLSAIQQKRMDSLNNMLAASNDPQSFAAAKMVWLNENPGETIPPQLQTYNADTIEALKKVTKAGQEEAKRVQASQNEAEKDAYRRASAAERVRHDTMLEKAQRARADFNERSLAARVKATGNKAKTVTSPKNLDVQAADAMIRADYPDLDTTIPLGSGKDAPLVSSAAYDLANEAKALMTRRGGMSMTEAMTQVYGRMKQAGEFQQTPKTPTMFQKLTGQDPGKRSSYKSATTEPAERFIPGKTKPVEGKIYDPGDGSKWKFDGKKMVSVE